MSTENTTQEKRIEVLHVNELQEYVVQMYVTRRVKETEIEVAKLEHCLKSAVIETLVNNKKVDEKIKCYEYSLRVYESLVVVSKIDKLVEQVKAEIGRELKNRYGTLGKIGVDIVPEKYWVIAMKGDKEYAAFAVNVLRLDEFIAYDYELREIYL